MSTKYNKEFDESHEGETDTQNSNRNDISNNMQIEVNIDKVNEEHD
jgi:hypothetical protein